MSEVNLNASARMTSNRMIDLRLTEAGQREFVSISQENGGGYSHFNYGLIYICTINHVSTIFVRATFKTIFQRP